MKIKTSELIGPALDWAVAKCDGALHPLGNVRVIDSKWLLICVGGDPNHGASRVYFRPSTDWAQGGPIIERERLSIRPDVAAPEFRAFVIRPPIGLSHRYIGSTPLIAAMRCYVASKLGDEVDVPKELI